MSGASLTSRLTARETEILRILQIIYPDREKFTIIGGYAVDAYSPLPRYSVDCDIVISKSDLDLFTKIFDNNGFGDPELMYNNELEGLETRRFKKLVGGEAVSIDLLIDGVRCRQTEAIWTQQEIKLQSINRRIVGVNDSVPSNVATLELIIAMKLHSGRDADLRDATMISDSADWNRVAVLSNKGDKQKVVNQLESAKEKIMRSEFEQELKAYFGSKQREEKRIRAMLKKIDRLLATIK